MFHVQPMHIARILGATPIEAVPIVCLLKLEVSPTSFHHLKGINHIRHCMCRDIFWITLKKYKSPTHSTYVITSLDTRFVTWKRLLKIFYR